MGCYGSTKAQTPTIDKLVNEGIRVTDFHSNGVVYSPTRASLYETSPEQFFQSQGNSYNGRFQIITI